MRRAENSFPSKQVIRGCKAAWLGSWDAYNEFKRLESQIVLDGPLREGLDQNLIRSIKIQRCFSQVVNSGVDPTVGGMTVIIRTLEGENTFQYMAGMIAVTSDWPQILKLGEPIMLFQGAEKGSYCCNVYQSNHNFCCYVYEDNCGMVFSDDVVYTESLDGMKFPVIYKMDKQLFDDVAERNGAYSCIDFCR